MTPSIRTIVPILLAAVGCAVTNATTTPYRQLPPTAVGDVAVFTDAPSDRPYEEIGLIEVQKLGITGGYGQLIERARLEAAKMGADAIIVTRTPDKHSTTIANETGRNRRGQRNIVATTTEHEDPRITVSAIVWKPRS
jgi:hypothetical protein